MQFQIQTLLPALFSTLALATPLESRQAVPGATVEFYSTTGCTGGPGETRFLAPNTCTALVGPNNKAVKVTELDPNCSVTTWTTPNCRRSADEDNHITIGPDQVQVCEENGPPIVSIKVTCT